MSVSIQTVEFERREAHLSELDDGAPWTVHGVALGAGDVTVGQSGIKKLWPAAELEKSAETLEGRNLVVDHNNDAGGVVGQVTKAGYKENVGVIYEAELFDEELAQKINNGFLEVSIRGKHIDVDTMEENEEGAKIVEGIKFDNLSIVPTGAAPSNTLEMGETEELSVSELAAFTDDLDAVSQLAEIEPGMWVEGDDVRGITISAVEDGEIEVDIYEESDGKWRSTGETEMMGVDSLTEWDVDEEEDIGAQQNEEDESEDEESEDEEENAVTTGDGPSQDADPQEMQIPDEYFFEAEEDAMAFVEEEDGLTGVHEMDGMFVPGDTHEEFMDWWDNQSSQSKHGDEEEMSRVEGEEEVGDKEGIREQSPERFIDEDEEELEGSVHEPTFSGTDDNEWNKPSLNDFTEESWEDLSNDEKSSIGGHFIFSMTGFPADNFSDMKLPVVRPNGTLSMNAVRNAKSRLSQTDGLSDDQRDRVESMLNDMLGDDEEEAGVHGKRDRTIDDTGHEESVEDTGPVDVSLDLINKYLRLEGKHERDSVDKMLGWLFGANDLPMETVSDFRTSANAFLDQTAGTDSFDGATIEQFRDWLLMHGDGSRGRREQDVQERGDLPPGFASPVHVLTGDDLQQSADKSGESELDDITTKVLNMTEEIEEKLAELNEPVAVEQDDLEELQQKADRFEEMSSTLEDLKERTDILDEADREQVEELAEADEPVVVESARMDELEGEAEQVKKVYAAALSEELSAFSAEEFADKFSIEELREKYEEQIGDPAEELASSESAEPQSGDPSEEELEESAEQESEEELSEEDEEAEEMRAELRSKILSR